MAVYLGKNKVELFGGQRVAVDGTTLPTLTNPGTASDLAEGMELIGADGNVVTGAVKTYSSQAGWSGITPSVDDTNVKLSINTNTPYLFRKGLYIKSPLSNFGDASASDVAKSKTFTSQSGLKVTGNLEEPDELVGFFLTPTAGDGSVNLSMTNNSRCILNKDVAINLSTSLDEFGDATAADVAAGKTFTSTAGLKVTGTGTVGANSGSFAVKTGTTTSNVINTGLSSISYIIIYKTSISATGFIQGVYHVETGKTSYVYCSSYSSYLKTCATVEDTNGSTNGGTFTWNGSDAQALTSGTTYNWIAIGT